jgi:peptidoglycan/LPS O-acetylase OafA/YrhL
MAFARHSDNSGDSQFIRISNVDPYGSYVSGIDGLRAFAVLSVIAYHLKSEFLLGGFVGVDVFFVISGYVVTNSIISRHFVSFKEVVLYFYARRFLRIMPALIVMLLIASMATIAFVPDAWLSQSNRNTAFFCIFWSEQYPTCPDCR